MIRNFGFNFSYPPDTRFALVFLMAICPYHPLTESFYTIRMNSRPNSPYSSSTEEE